MAPEQHPQVPALIAREGAVYASSKDVAAYFEKRHDHVLRDIDAFRHAPDLGDGWFREHRTPHPTIAGRLDRSFEMTRDGFTILVMGWTGEKAMGFKLRYLAQFNAMEAEMRSRAPALPDFSNPVLAARAWADAWEAKAVAEVERERAEIAKVAAEAQVVELTPMATVGLLAAASGHSLMTVLRGLPYVNVNKAQGALADLGYLRRVSKGKGRCIFRVNRSRAAGHFLEGVPDEYGAVVITPTKSGRILLGRLYRGGHLPMLNGHKPQGMLKAIGAA